MQLPASLIERVEQIIQGTSMKALQNRWSEMSMGYRMGEAPELDDLGARAYMVGRLPATYAAFTRALQLSTQLECPQWTSHLDVGSGPGAAIWAARSIWPALQSVAVERAPSWLRLAPSLTDRVEWKRGDLSTSAPLPKAQLVTAGYVLNELPSKDLPEVLKRLWNSCEGWLVLVEPGTPAGYERILAARDWLCQQGGHVVAPCPGAVPCPLVGSAKWCHFGVRFNRPRFQRLSKGAEVGWEDEFFSFIAMSREPCQVPEGRLLHFPQKRGGHVWVDLCTRDGLHKKVLSRRDGALYKASRRLHWGDSFPPVVDENAGEGEAESEL